MSEFEYSDSSGDESFDEEVVFNIKRKKIESTLRITKELRLYYSNLFIDCFNLIDLFVKSEKFTYDSFLLYFDSVKFHQIYCMTPKKKLKVLQNYISPHHYISTTQDAFAVASKFLRSRSKESRIGAIYLLYTLFKTQPLKTYPIRIKMEPKDYNSTKKLVDKCLNEGLVHPAYYFYELDIRKQIVITASAVNPSLEANYPRQEIRKHLGRVADHYFQTKYEAHEVFDPLSKFKLMEDQLRTELAYINKLSKMTLCHTVSSEYKPEISQLLLHIDNSPKYDTDQNPSDKNTSLKKANYKHKKNIAFPGKNDNILDDMVQIPDQQIIINKPKEKPKSVPKNSTIRIKSAMRAWKQVEGKSNICGIPIEQNNPTEPSLLSDLIEADSSDSSIETDDDDSNDNYEEMIWAMVEDINPNEII